MTAFDSPDFKLNEQQEAVKNFIATHFKFNDEGGHWFTSYELTGQRQGVNGKMVTIGDAGRRMRELREAGILESRKRGRYEEYRLKPRTLAEQGWVGVKTDNMLTLAFDLADSYLQTSGPHPGMTLGEAEILAQRAEVRTVHSREEAYELEDKGWKIVDRKLENGFFMATLTR